MTPRQLLKRIQFWQVELVHLGVSHAQIKQVYITEEVPGGAGALAAVSCSENYDDVEFWFHPSMLEREAQELDETIIHEWLHVAWRDMDFVCRRPEDHMAPAVFSEWDAHLNHETEGLIDRTARQLCVLWYSSQT